VVGLWFGAPPFNVYFAVNVLPLTQCYVARGDVCKEKMSFNHFSGKAEIGSRSNLKIYIAIYFRCYTVHVVVLLNYYTNYCTYIKFTH